MKLAFICGDASGRPSARFGFLCLMMISSAHVLAGEIYRWVDEKGKTHYSDTVPEKYRESAVTTTPHDEPSDEQRREAEERAAAERRRASERGTDAPGQVATPMNRGPQESRAVKGKQPNDAAVDCETQHRLYRESQACFNRYLLATGGIREEAFKNCTEVADPTPTCGLSSWRPSTERTYGELPFP